MEKYLLEKLYLQQNFQAFQQYIVETIQFFCFQHHPTMQSFTQNTHKMMMMQRKIIELRKMRRKRENQSIHASVPYPNMAREKPLIKSTINLLWAYMIHSQNTHNQLQIERERRREKRQFEKASKSKQTQCKDENISYLRPETRHRSSCRTS